MGIVVRFPGDLITEHDRRRLTIAAEGSPFDIDFRLNERGLLTPFLTRCGHMRANFRLRKSSEGWEAVSLDPDNAGAIAARARRAEDLFKALSAPPDRG
ncbi:MAG: hypothetical protein WCY02_01365 [Parvibaculum sp.]